jgi:hypothetical protein
LASKILNLCVLSNSSQFVGYRLGKNFVQPYRPPSALSGAAAMGRPEVTGKKTTEADNRATRGHNRGPPLDDDGPKYRRRPVSADANSLAMSIKEFCRLHGISEDQFYKMQRGGWGPTTMKVGSRTLISHEAAAEWRRSREEAAAKEAASTAA